MTTQSVEAVYEQGAFRLIQSLPIPFHEGQRVRSVVDIEQTAPDVLALATSVLDGLSEQDARDIDAIARKRDPFFGDRS